MAARASAAAAEDALRALAETSPRDYLRREAGRPILDLLYARCLDAGLVDRPADDSVGRLYAILTVATRSGMGALVLDYIAEVCSDPSISSADPVEAFMLDGECVRSWALSELERCEADLVSLLRSVGRPDRGSGAAGAASRVVVAAGVLELVFRGLAPVPPAVPREAPGSLGSSPEADRAANASLCARAVRWVVDALPGGWEPVGAGRFRSAPEWRAACSRRRELGFDRLGELLASLRVSHGVQDALYPPGDHPDAFLRPVLLSGLAGGAAERLSALLYYLADAGAAPPAALSRRMGSEFHEHADDLRLAALSYTADALATATPGQGPTEADLEELKALVNNTDSTRVPPSTIHALVVGSRPGLALQIVRSRGVAHRSSLNEARLWLEVRLAAGVFAEATLELLRHLRETPASRRREHAQTLLPDLLGWAHEQRQLSSVIRLPFFGFAEEAILSWFAEKARSDPAVALLWTLYYLVRGRNAEALVSQRLGAAAAEESVRPDLRPQRAAILEMLRVASRCVPAPLGEVAAVVDPIAEPSLQPAPAQLPPGAVAFAELLAAQSDASRSVATVASGPTLLEVPLVGDAAALRALTEERSAAASDAPAQPRRQDQAPRVELTTPAATLGGAAPPARPGTARSSAPTAFSRLTGSVLWAR